MPPSFGELPDSKTIAVPPRGTTLTTAASIAPVPELANTRTSFSVAKTYFKPTKTSASRPRNSGVRWWLIGRAMASLPTRALPSGRGSLGGVSAWGKEEEFGVWFAKPQAVWSIEWARASIPPNPSLLVGPVNDPIASARTRQIRSMAQRIPPARAIDQNGPSRGIPHLGQQCGDAEHHDNVMGKRIATTMSDRTIRSGINGRCMVCFSGFPNFADRQGRCQGVRGGEKVGRARGRRCVAPGSSPGMGTPWTRRLNIPWLHC